MPSDTISLVTRIKTKPVVLDATRLLDVARERAPDPAVFETHQPYFWQAQISSNARDFYGTRMHRSTLDNFAVALQDGISFQDSHNVRKLGWGQSLDGEIIRTDEDDAEIGEKRLVANGTFFTLDNLNLNGQNTSDFLAAIRAGIWRDVSVGFAASDFRCSICGKNPLRWWDDDGCPHIPGVEYDIDGVKRMAFAWVHDGELHEVSQVYDGATPGAAVYKAEGLALEGRLADPERMQIEQRYHVRLKEPDRRWAVNGRGIAVPTKESPVGTKPETNSDAALAVINDAVTRLADAGITFAADVVLLEDRFAILADDLVAAREQVATDKAEIDRLTPLAKDGERYRTNLIEDTLKEGVRAHGSEWSQDAYRKILESLDIDGIRTIQADFERIATARLGSGGRHTRDDADPEGPNDNDTQPAPRRRRRR
jgi:hypothetical protein